MPRRSAIFGSIALGLIVLDGFAGSAATAAPRRIAVLEYRSGVRAAFGLAQMMARQLAKLTPHRVISPRDAQRELGSRVSAEVATCKGDPICIAGIGKRLRCDEVMLVGISQLGDVILAIQRIAVPSGKVLSRLADSVSSRRRIRRRVINRYLRRLLPPDEFKRYGRIIIRTEAVGDRVFLDEILRGRTPLAPIKVPAPGRYTVRITRRGHLDFVARLDVLPEASVQVKPTLSPRGSVRARKWYERWWVWALVGGVVVGGTTAAVLGATRSPSDVDAVVRWPTR